MRLLIAAGLGLLVALPSGAVEPRNTIAIDEWEVPYPDTRPRDPHAHGNAVWFVGQRGHYLAQLDPATGTFAKVDLGDAPGPHNLIVGRDGAVWYAGNLKGHIGRRDPATGAIDRIAMPTGAARDPHTLIFDADERHIWFTVQQGNFVGRLTVATRAVELIPVPTRSARPYGIVVAPDGTPWIALFGTNKLASVDPATLELTEHVLPDRRARPRRLVVTTDGRVYYVDYAGGALGRLDPKTGAVETWPMPSGDRARPYGMAVDARDRIWFVETGPSPNALVGFAPGTAEFFSSTPIPSGGRSVRHMMYHPPSGSIWFGTDANTIGRALVGGG